MNEKHEINTKRSFTILCVVVALMAGGFFVVRHIQQRNNEAEAEVSQPTVPSSAMESSEDYEFEIIRDGIIGIEPEDTEPTQAAVMPTTSPADEADDNQTPTTAGTGTTPAAPAATTAPATASTPTPATGTTEGTTTPTAPVTNPAPTDGSTNSEGQVYVPGFGWISRTGENTQTVSHGDGEGKQIGTMG